MWSRRSRTSTRFPSWLAARSATVSPKKPEPTTMRSGASDATVAEGTGVGVPPPGPKEGAGNGVEANVRSGDDPGDARPGAPRRRGHVFAGGVARRLPHHADCGN